MPDSVTQILASGPAGTKKNIAVLGDGFAAGADQTTYNNKVQALLLDGGISGQLLVRDSSGAARVWPGSRSVPLGLVGRTR